ncbi:putative archaetidylglycerolphosphate synthase [Natrialba magadii ATCC 43099]|uniref:Archaetidylglycerolphosphate synthase n=1 Tax=Natrialba magadii (strain ATCC 43099 / DSM 3394 / CCM 3739 / CIP 104546 / IAM 13178 / JCM 8861 / NBRC 102185 / NCIMB 2190 / MS3) TaxID=547559 RepID=D3SYT0_NATMM|nr:CDP-alcohol phosphatidyltransferase family protein [Natrialba magadii]ADD04191.1 putative archaetidylglycerolphosphate synthase [Natrialba magadii ATCC 43099]ELY26596.1 CDP-alcohol phosphatidyltransferase [Natrialba magadii ATCC 43099]
MTLDKFRPYISRFLDPFVKGFDRIGMSPDGVSIVAFGMAVLAAGAFFLGGRAAPVWYAVAAALVFLNGWLDIVDGALAREQEVASAGGDLLDHVLDRYADIVIIAGLAAGIGDYLLGFLAVTGVVMTSYLGTQAQAVGLDRVYGGLVGRADRLAIIGVVGFLAYPVSGEVAGLTLIGWLLVFLAVVGHLTALQRFFYSWSALE